MALDRVKLSLDSATEETLRKLDRPHHLNLNAMIRAMADFRIRYRGELMIEILVVSGLNDTEVEFDALSRVLTDINPDRIDVGTIARPPAYGVQPVNADRLTQLAARLNHPAVHIITPKNTRPAESYSREEILATLQKRPLSLAETKALFDSQSQQMLQALLENGMVEVTQTGSEKFYKIARNT
jgi:wyosine [tRNA(Phe)-imidazoG37] synthetase (radical SAM superfamily)